MADTDKNLEEKKTFRINYHYVPECVYQAILQKQAYLKIKMRRYITFSETLNIIVRESIENECKEAA